jgi:hypothetical protein
LISFVGFTKEIYRSRNPCFPDQIRSPAREFIEGYSDKVRRISRIVIWQKWLSDMGPSARQAVTATPAAKLSKQPIH